MISVAAIMSSGIDKDALAFINAAGITDSTQIRALNNLCRELKRIGVWGKLTACYPFIGGTATTHKFNLKNPADTDAAFRLTFVNSPTHSSSGVQGNGTTQYADTHMQAGALSNFDAHLSFYSRTNPAGVAVGIGSFNNVSSITQINTSTTANNGNVIVGTTAVIAFSSGVTDTRGFHIGSRVADNDLRYYFNGSQVSSNTGTQAAYTNTSRIFILARSANNAPQLYTTQQCAFASIGSGLTTTEMANYYTAVQAFQTTLGRNV